MFGLLLRVFLIGLVIYIILALIMGWYNVILQHYRWMTP